MVVVKIFDKQFISKGAGLFALSKDVVQGRTGRYERVTLTGRTAPFQDVEMNWFRVLANVTVQYCMTGGR